MSQDRPLRCVVATQNDPFFVLEFFHNFFARYANSRDWLDIRGLVIQQALGKKKMDKLVKQMWDFFGPVDFVRMGLSYVMRTTAGRTLLALGVNRPALTIEQATLAAGVPLRTDRNVNDPAFLEWLRREEIDVLVSVAASQKFKPELLATPKWGCLNSHSGALPRFRGMLPVFWTMQTGETHATVTIHKMNEELDDGEILLQGTVPIGPGASLAGLIRRTKELSVELMLQALRSIHDGSARLLPNDRSKSTYFSFPTQTDVAEFRRRGFRLL